MFLCLNFQSWICSLPGGSSNSLGIHTCLHPPNPSITFPCHMMKAATHTVVMIEGLRYSEQNSQCDWTAATNSHRPPGRHLGQGLNKVIYLHLHRDYYLNCHSAIGKVFMGKQFSPRDLLSSPWITTESGITQNKAIVIIISHAVEVSAMNVLNVHHHHHHHPEKL